MGAAKRSKLLISFKMDPKSIKIITFSPKSAKISHFSSKIDRICTRACILWSWGLQNLTFFIRNRPDLHAGVHFVDFGAPKFDIFDPKSTGFARGRAFSAKSPKLDRNLTKIDRICTRACIFLEVTRFAYNQPTERPLGSLY